MFLTPMVAIKKPARCESHPNISEERQGTEETIISYWDGKRKQGGKLVAKEDSRTQGRVEENEVVKRITGDVPKSKSKETRTN